MGPQLEGQLFLVDSPRYGYGPEAELMGKLQRQMPQPADALHGHQVASPRAAVLQGAEDRAARAEQRRPNASVKLFRDRHEGFGAGDHILGVAAVDGETRDDGILTGPKVAPAAGRTREAMTAMPAHAHPLPDPPVIDARPQPVDHPHDFVPRYSRIRHAGEMTFLYGRFSMANAARLNLHQDFARFRLGNFPVHQLKIAAPRTYLNCSHHRHWVLTLLLH